MPELPEVETVVRGLRRTVVGRTITDVRVNAPAASTFVSSSLRSSSFASALRGRRIEGVNRRGKNILMALSGGVTLWTHLKMTGHFFWLPESEPTGKHDLVVFLMDGTRTADRGHSLRFNDYRRFGRLRVLPDDELWQQEGLVDLGPEPLEITPEGFVKLLRSSHRMVKPALLDQTFLAGIGNIYADESLWAAKIHPRRSTSSLSAAKLRELHGHLQRLLRKAIRLMGTSVDSYSGVNGQPGRFQKYLRAYGNEGLPCAHCGTLIVREKVGSRSAHFCPRCQRLR